MRHSDGLSTKRLFDVTWFAHSLWGGCRCYMATGIATSRQRGPHHQSHCPMWRSEGVEVELRAEAMRYERALRRLA